jgi:transposase
MDPLYPHAAGLDVHKDSVVACVRHQGPGPVRQTVRTFATHTAALQELADWLADEAVSHVALESTGVYWKPVFNLLEGRFDVLLVNARHIKQVPGRKTDVKDCVWIARLLQHGLLRPSFVPPAAQRELRDLTRQRAQLTAQKAAVANRIQKVLEDANIKLAGVATDVLGKSGRAMLEALVAGETDPAKLADLARRRLREKLPQLRRALAGRVTEHHRFLLRLHLDQLQQLEGLIERLAERLGEKMAPFAVAVGRLTTIPGISRQVAEVVVAEVGVDMGRFATAGQLASWAGMCPGNNQSAGKRRSGRTTAGDRWLRPALVQAAWGAARSKGTSLAARFRRLAARRGRKRALVAVGHALLGVVWRVLKDGVSYEELGADYFERAQAGRLTKQLVRRLERLGHKVTLEPQEHVA